MNCEFYSQERLELVRRLKDKIQKEINEFIEHYFNRLHRIKITIS